MNTVVVKLIKILSLGMFLSLGNQALAKQLDHQYFVESIDMTWTEITITSNDVTLEDLASTYYGDVKDANIIYNANRKVIGTDKKLHINMHLKIPITDKFRDQPEHLGWR